VTAVPAVGFAGQIRRPQHVTVVAAGGRGSSEPPSVNVWTGAQTQGKGKAT